MGRKGLKKIWISAISVAAALIIAFAACGIYVGIYYHATDEAKAVFSEECDFEIVPSKHATAFIPQNAEYGLIFYPGGKVEDKAYAPLMSEFARRGVLCVLIKMPFNLAVLKVNAAKGIQKDYPYITSWCIGGHSLGGAMSASYASKHSGEFTGVMLLGAYSTKDLSSSGLKVASIYGTQDKVMNKKKYDKYLSNLPADFAEKVIEGGCHSYFGNYGMQKGDGVPTVTRDEQMSLTAVFVIENVFSISA